MQKGKISVVIKFIKINYNNFILKLKLKKKNKEIAKYKKQINKLKEQNKRLKNKE